MTNKPPEKRMNELELTLRTIDDLLPELPTSALKKWKAIIYTLEAKIDEELKNTCLHQCRICFFSEYGYRDELPSFWYKKGDAEICFQHEYKDAEKLLKDAGYETDAFFPPEVENPSIDALKVTMDNLPEKPSEQEETLEELMSLL